MGIDEKKQSYNYARTEAIIKWCFAEYVFFLYLINYTIELSCRAALAIGQVFGELISSIEYDQSE